MARSNDNAPRAPFIESLESRQLFATAPLPDLVPSLTTSFPAVVQPGAAVGTSLKITNNGAAMTKATYVPIRLYASPTRTLAPGATPFKTIQKSLNLAAGGSTTVSLSTETIPTTVKFKKYFLIAVLNNRKALVESSTKNNTVVSSALNNPVGKYTGDFSASDHRPGTLTLGITPNTSPFSITAALSTDVTLTTGGMRIHLQGVKSKISNAGLYQLKTNGSYRDPSLGKVTYYIRIRATYSGNTLTGTFQLHWHTNTASRTANGDFTLKRP